MNKFKNFVKSLLERGYATEEEKAKAAEMFKSLDGEDQPEVQGDADAVADLPESAEDAEAEDEEDETVEKSIRDLFKRERKAVVTEVKNYLEEQKELIAKGAGVYHKDAQAKREHVNGV